MGVGTLPSAYCYCAWRRSIPPWSRRGGRWVPSHGARPNVSVLGVCTLKFVPPVQRRYSKNAANQQTEIGLPSRRTPREQSRRGGRGASSATAQRARDCEVGASVTWTMSNMVQQLVGWLTPPSCCSCSS